MMPAWHSQLPVKSARTCVRMHVRVCEGACVHVAYMHGRMGGWVGAYACTGVRADTCMHDRVATQTRRPDCPLQNGIPNAVYH